MRNEKRARSEEPRGPDKAPLLLVTATLQEMRAVLLAFGDRAEVELNRPMLRPYQGEPFLLLVTGVGPINAAMSLGRVFGSGAGVRGVLNLGIGGSFEPDALPLLSKVAITEEIWPEIGVRTQNGIEVRALKSGLGQGQGDLIQDRLSLDPDATSRSLGLHLPAGWPRVRSLSLAGVTGTGAEAKQRAFRYQVQLENMEGFSLAWVCMQEQVPFVELRSISNRVGSRNREDWDLKGSFTVLTQMSRELLCSSPKSVLA